MIDVLLTKIRSSERQAISYETFIETALYEPKKGYYTGEKEKIGRSGDFLTTSEVSSVYGKIMGNAFLKWLTDNQLPLVIYEIGGGNGSFAEQVVKTLFEKGLTEFTYTLIETSPYHRKLQQNRLGKWREVRIVESIDEVEVLEGIIFSNELFDAFPVHVIEKFQQELFEVWIGEENGRLVEHYLALENPAIQEYMTFHNLTLYEGQRYEIPLAVESFLKKVQKKWKKGLMITVDYGLKKEELHHISRKNGTLRGYYQHQLIENPLLYPGEMDITYHIHVDEYLSFCETWGIQTEKVLSQKEFFLEEGILDLFISHSSRDPFSKEARWNRALQSLCREGGMSDAFTVIIQKKQ